MRARGVVPWLLVSILVIVISAAGNLGCGDDSESEDEPTVATTEVESEEPADSTETEADEEPSEPAPEPEPEPEPEPKPDESESALTAKLGETLELKTIETTVAVTVEEVIDPLKVGQFDVPIQKGAKFIGIELTIENIGDGPYSDAPSIGTTIITDEDEQVGYAILGESECGSFGAGLDLAPGDLRTGCLPFEFPKDQRPVRVQFTPDTGLAEETGEWILE